MINFTVYNSQGLILRSGLCPEDFLSLQANSSNGETSIEASSNDTLDYIPDPTNPVITPRPNNPSIVDKTTVITGGIDKIILSSTPIGSSITLESLTDISDGTDIDLVFDIPGTYTLKVELFPYFPFEATINAT